MNIKVADIVFLVTDCWSPILEDKYKDFSSTDKHEITIRVYNGAKPKIPLHDKNRVFDSELIWSLYQRNEYNIFVLKMPDSHNSPYRIAIFDTQYKKGEIYTDMSQFEHISDNIMPDPLEFPLSEILMVCLLSQERGLMIHACGIDDSGRGYLLAGNSTHGKTTLARLWKNQATILNDDRIVIRKRDGKFWIYGTPWHGEYTDVSSKGVPIEKVFFLQHSKSNSFEKISGAGAASILLARSFPPLWDSEGMKFTLDFCSQLVSAVPCYRLNFKPDKSIIDFVRCVN
jgi:hypothetical protein